LEKRDIWSTLSRIDAKLLYALLAVFIIVPLIKPLGLPMSIPAETRAAYDFIDALPDGSLVLLSVGTDPQTEAETWAQAIAMGRHLLSKKCNLVLMSVNSVGQPYAERLASILQEEFGLEYGQDICVLGFRAGEETAVAGFAGDFLTLYNADYKGAPVKELPMLKGVSSAADFKLIIDYQYKASAIWFARHVGGPHKVPVIAGSRASSAPNMMPYYASGDFKGVLPGIQGGAAYERLLQRPDQATKGLDAQSMGLILVILSVLIGNVATVMGAQAKSKKA